MGSGNRRSRSRWGFIYHGDSTAKQPLQPLTENLFTGAFPVVTSVTLALSRSPWQLFLQILEHTSKRTFAQASPKPAQVGLCLDARQHALQSKWDFQLAVFTGEVLGLFDLGEQGFAQQAQAQ